MAGKTTPAEKIDEREGARGRAPGRRGARMEQHASGQAGHPLAAAGNMALQRLLRSAPVQSQLAATGPGDIHEQEARRAADRAASTLPEIQAGEAAGAGRPAPAAPSAQGDLRGSGQPLPDSTRALLEPHFGQDFSRVRVHTDADAVQQARALQARAFTLGSDIAFDAGEYAPESREGRRLLAHELAHVVQQSGGHAPVTGGRFSPALRQVQRQPVGGGTAPAATPSTTPGTSANAALSQAAGVPVTAQSLTLSATIAAGQVLSSDSDKTIHTEQATGASLYVTGTRLTVSFTPPAIITMTSWPRPNIWLQSFYWDFATASYGASYEARGATYALAWASGPSLGDRIMTGVGALFSKMPAAMRAPRYDPFADPNIQSNLAALAAGLASGGAGGGAPAASSITLSAQAVLGGEIRRTSGRFSLVVPTSTEVRLDVNLSGGIPSSLRDIRVSSIRLSLRHPSSTGANVEFRIMDVGVPVVFVDAANFSSGGHVQLAYTLGTEAIEGLFRALAAAAAVREGRRVGEGALDYSQPRLHALVDAEVSQHLEPLLRAVVMANRNIIPGMDLAEALGYPAAAGAAPP